MHLEDDGLVNVRQPLVGSRPRIQVARGGFFCNFRIGLGCDHGVRPDSVCSVFCQPGQNLLILAMGDVPWGLFVSHDFSAAFATTVWVLHSRVIWDPWLANRAQSNAIHLEVQASSSIGSVNRRLLARPPAPGSEGRLAVTASMQELCLDSASGDLHTQGKFGNSDTKRKMVQRLAS